MKVRTTDDIRANPIIGDMIVTKDYPPGTPLHEITEFEIWDGARWVPSTEAGDLKIYMSTSL